MLWELASELTYTSAFALVVLAAFDVHQNDALVLKSLDATKRFAAAVGNVVANCAPSFITV